jgi:hypothetical protein
MAAPRRTYVVSIYDDGARVLVQDVARDERAQLDDLEDLPARIRDWEEKVKRSPESPP